jgi:hypothetical protein
MDDHHTINVKVPISTIKGISFEKGPDTPLKAFSFYSGPLGQAWTKQGKSKTGGALQKQ